MAPASGSLLMITGQLVEHPRRWYSSVMASASGSFEPPVRLSLAVQLCTALSSLGVGQSVVHVRRLELLWFTAARRGNPKESSYMNATNPKNTNTFVIIIGTAIVVLLLVLVFGGGRMMNGGMMGWWR